MRKKPLDCQKIRMMFIQSGKFQPEFGHYISPEIDSELSDSVRLCLCVCDHKLKIVLF